MLDNRIRLPADIEVQLERVAIVQVGIGAHERNRELQVIVGSATYSR